MISSNSVGPSSKLSYIPSDRLIFQKQSLKKINNPSKLGTNFSLTCKALHKRNLPYLSNLSPMKLCQTSFPNSYSILLQMSISTHTLSSSFQ